MRRALLIAGVVASLVASACTSGEETSTPPAAGPEDDTPSVAPPTPAREPTRVRVMATDHAFDLPSRISAGLVTFELVNRGQEIHHAQLVRLKAGGDLDAAVEALTTGDFKTLDRHVESAGGVGIIVPGATAAATVELIPGTYALLCGIPDADGTAHAAHGMVQAFTVTGPAPDAAAAIETVGQVTLRDFAFDLPADLKGRVAVTNAGAQEHEMLLFRISPGATLEDVLGSLLGPPSDGPPPGMPVGGMQALRPGDTGYLDLAGLEAGTYGLVCFIPDPASGRPHLQLGMVSEITVA